MIKKLFVWGVNHKGNGGFNTALFESESTPIDVLETISGSDLRETKIIQEDSSRFYSISLSENHRIYSIYTYTKDHQERNGFTAISIYTNKNRVLSNVFVSLNKALEIYLNKRDSIYPNMFEEILDEIKIFENYNSDENKSSGTSCFYAIGENNLKYFLDNANTQQYQKVYVTNDNIKIKEKYPVYSTEKKNQSVNTPLKYRNSSKKNYLYIIISVFLLISLGWFVSTLLNDDDIRKEHTGKSKVKNPISNQIEIEDVHFQNYKIRLDSISGNYNWFHENGTKVKNLSKRILLRKEYQDTLKNFPGEVLEKLKLSIQQELISEDGVKILLETLNNIPMFPENLLRLEKLEVNNKLISKQIRYSSNVDLGIKKLQFKVKKKGKWEIARDTSLYKEIIFKYYLKGIEKLMITPDITNKNLNSENKDNPEKSSDKNNTRNPPNKVPKPPEEKQKCKKQELDVTKLIEELHTELKDGIAMKDKEKFIKKLEKKIKDLDDNCPKFKDHQNRLRDLISEIREN